MAGDFQAKMAQIQADVGFGTLTGSVIVDQVYAQNQHESTWFKHPRGGSAKYLILAFREQQYNVLMKLSLNLRGLIDAMMSGMETTIRSQVAKTPVLYGNLKASGSPSVLDNGARVRYRPAAQRRLSDAELRTQART